MSVGKGQEANVQQTAGLPLSKARGTGIIMNSHGLIIWLPKRLALLGGPLGEIGYSKLLVLDLHCLFPFLSFFSHPFSNCLGGHSLVHRSRRQETNTANEARANSSKIVSHLRDQNDGIVHYLLVPGTAPLSCQLGPTVPGP